MSASHIRLLVVAALAGAPWPAALTQDAVPARKEKHHRFVDEDKMLRVLRVVVRTRDATALHHHESDYFWIAVGSSEIVDSTPGSAAVRIVSPNLGVHFESGGRTHLARNAGARDYENITVEFLEPQTNARNLCAEAVAGAPKTCPEPLVSPAAGVRAYLAFATDQVVVSVMNFAPGATLTGADTQTRPWFVAWNDNARRGLRLPGAHTNPAATQDGRDWGYGAWRPPTLKEWYVTNSSTIPLQVLAITPTAP